MTNLNQNLIKRIQFNTISTLFLSDQVPFQKSQYYNTIDYLSNNQLSSMTYQWDLNNSEKFIIQTKAFGLNFPIFIWNKNPKDEVSAKKTLTQYLDLLKGFCDIKNRKSSEIKCLLVLDTEDGLNNSPLWKALIDRFTENGTKYWGSDNKTLSIDIFSTI